MAEQAARAPRVTVVTRTRNRPLMLTRAVQSVGAQTFQDLELVIVNDAGESEAVDQALASAPEWVRKRTQVVTNETSPWPRGRSGGRPGRILLRVLRHP